MRGCAIESTVACPTLVELLRWRAQERGGQRLYTFLGDGEEETAVLTFAELDCQARILGARLQSMNAQGERVLLLYPPGMDFIVAFFGCLYAGAVAVPAYPPRQNRNLLRLQSIVADAQAGLVMTTAFLFTGIKPSLQEIPELEKLQWLLTDQTEGIAESDWREPSISAETLAFLQYTSGSTSAPKGVMLSHGNLLHNTSLIAYGFECGGGKSSGVSWLPPYHDMGMIGGILEPLYVGAPMVIMPPVAFLQRPFRWLQAISRYRATVSGGPNFAYDMCARKVSPEQRATLDLSCWEVAFTGAEPVRAETMKRFSEVFSPCGFHYQSFYPCYGLAEGTLIVSGGTKDSEPVVKTFHASALEENRVVEIEPGQPGARELVGCGGNLPDQKIAIVNPESLTECYPDEIGEIWVKGPSIAKGYWQRPEESEHTLQAQLSEIGEGPFLRTGDLGFMCDGELFITGRSKDLIIADGRNHYPQDIELTVERSHPAIRPGCSAAFSVDLGGRECLVVVAELERQYRNADQEEITKIVRRAVAEHHELRLEHLWLVKTGDVPKTSSGKIQRYACRAEFLANLAASRKNLAA